MMRYVEKSTVKFGLGWIFYIKNKRRKNIGYIRVSGLVLGYLLMIGF